jgi:hypothetical protein
MKRKGGGTPKKLKLETQVKRPVLDTLCIAPTVSSNEMHAVPEALAIEPTSTAAPIQL